MGRLFRCYWGPEERGLSTDSLLCSEKGIQMVAPRFGLFYTMQQTHRQIKRQQKLLQTSHSCSLPREPLVMTVVERHLDSEISALSVMQFPTAKRLTRVFADLSCFITPPQLPRASQSTFAVCCSSHIAKITDNEESSRKVAMFSGT